MNAQIVDAWQVTYTQVRELWAMGIDGAGIKVGHLDTGVDGSHPALEGKVASFGKVDENWNVIEQTPSDINIHGTHLAGLICGSPVEDYRYCMAPGANLYSVQCHVIGHDWRDTLIGLDWLRSQGIRLICLPMGPKNQNPILEPMLRALKKEGIVVVCPSGNYGADKVTSPGHSKHCLTVGSLGPDGSVSNFSGRKPNEKSAKCDSPDLLAPGETIYSLAPGGKMMQQSGTSQSCAIVVGALALLMQAFPDRQPWELVGALKATASVTEGILNQSAFGAIDIMAAYRRLKNDTSISQGIGPEYAQRFIDPSLRAKLAKTDEIECIVTVQSGSSIHDLLSQFSDISASRPFEYASTAIITAAPAVIASLLGREELLMASCC